jgi:hypothetical protein
MAENVRSRSFLPLVDRTGGEHAAPMLLITCPVTGADVLLSTWDIRSLVNHPTHIEMTVACSCGATHVHRTGRHWRPAQLSAARRAEELIPA